MYSGVFFFIFFLRIFPTPCLGMGHEKLVNFRREKMFFFLVVWCYNAWCMGGLVA